MRIKVTRRFAILAAALTVGLVVLFAVALPAVSRTWEQGTRSSDLQHAVDAISEAGAASADPAATRSTLPTHVDQTALLARLYKAAGESGLKVTSGRATTGSFPLPTAAGQVSGQTYTLSVDVAGSASQLAAFTQKVSSTAPLTRVSGVNLDQGTDGTVTGSVQVTTFALPDLFSAGQA